MLLTVYCVRRDLSEVTFSLEVDADFELENFRALCELESGIPASDSLIVYAERPLTDNHRSLSSYGLKDGDVVILRQKEISEPQSAAPFPGLPRIDFSSIAVPGTSSQPQAPQPSVLPPDLTSFPQGMDNPALLRDMLLAYPHELSLLKERNPPLAEALLSGDLEKFTKVLLEQQQERARREQERNRLFSADPFDLDAQAKIEEDIRQHNIEENMTFAMEEAPESFGLVVMLYINCKVNGYPVKAFVDSGAQMTIMSQACAERCHIMRLVDRRWAGIAKGVGTQKIIGRVHLAQVQIEGDFLPCSFSILEEQPMDMLLGLDMLKRHQCSIDLEKNVLVIGTTGTRTTFLPEGELPECARLAYGPGREDMQQEEVSDRELAEVLQKSADEADKETTSLKAPSLAPLTDGLPGPAHSSGPASNPPARSTSAPTPVCSRLPTVAERVKPESTELLNLSNVTTSGDKSRGSVLEDDMQTGHPPVLAPPIAVQDSVAESLNPCMSAADAGTACVIGADQTTEAVQVLDLPASNTERADRPGSDLSSDIQQQIEPINETIEAEQPQSPFHLQDHVEDIDWELHSDVNLTTSGLLNSPTAALAESTGEGQGEGALSINITEAPMEVDTATPQSAVDSTCYTSGTETCESTVFPELQGNEAASRHAAVQQQIPSGIMMQFEDDNMSRAIYEAADSTSLDNCPDPPNTSVHDVGEECFSLATALKELHQLLVMSGPGSCRTAQDENPIHHSIETVLEDQDEDHFEKPHQNGFLNDLTLNQNAEDVCVTDHFVSDEGMLPEPLLSKTRTDGIGNSGKDEARSENVAYTDSCTESVMGLDLSDTTDLCRRSMESCTDSSVAFVPPHTYNSLVSNRSENCSENLNILSSLPVTQGEIRIGKETPAQAPGSDDRVPKTNAEPGMLLGGLHVSAAGSTPSLPPPLFPEPAVERIVSAGFTLQEAVNALEKADGNAELALLTLLAKSIIVPT
ncbi:protein DDI1 homolog 2 isoform X1 [Ascaphus truei]|uniref:protein DDI1 homolog 2 isoform X1 n=1 Tax=Ascaphus truei TaxID=8439 RepID=UPI003F59E46E